MIFNKEKFRINLLEPRKEKSKNRKDVAIGGPFACLDCDDYHHGVDHKQLCFNCYGKRLRDGLYIPPDD